MNSIKTFNEIYEKLSGVSINSYEVRKLLIQLIASISCKQNPVKLHYIFIAFMSFRFPNRCFHNNELAVSLGDYKRENYYNILKYVTGSKKTDYDFSKIGFQPFINIKNLFCSFWVIFKKLNFLSFKDRTYLFLSLTFYLNSANNLKKKTTGKPKRFLSFNSNQPPEALLTLFFKKEGVRTLSLQHALYRYPITGDSVDFLFYSHVNSDTLLTWSQYSLKNFKKYCKNLDECNILVGGYPSDTSLSPVKIPEPNKKTKIAVFLGWEINQDDNFSLLNQIISDKDTGKNKFYFIKLHPSLNFANYAHFFSNSGLKFNNNSVSETLSSERKIDLSITVNTTVYYESFLYGIPSFRFLANKINFDHNWVMETDIDSLKSITNILLFLQKKDGIDMLIRKRLRYLIGYGINNYKILLESQNG